MRPWFPKNTKNIKSNGNGISIKINIKTMCVPVELDFLEQQKAAWI